MNPPPASPEHFAARLRALLDSGQLADAAQLIDAFGPCDWPADGDPDASISSVILERYGDELAERDPAAAHPAYRRAADCQVSYAAFATAGGEGIARMQEADRLTAKAQGSP